MPLLGRVSGVRLPPFAITGVRVTPERRWRRTPPDTLQGRLVSFHPGKPVAEDPGGMFKDGDGAERVLRGRGRDYGSDTMYS